MIMPKNLVLILVFSVLASSIELDISVPGLPDISDYFGISDSLTQMTISINFVGYAIASVFVGPLSESYGRRSVMILGNAIMLTGAVGCVFADSIETLLFSRFIEGLGASTSPVLAFTMISDIYSGSKAAKLIGQLTSLLTIFMAIAPIAGGFITKQLGWRGNYTVVAVACLLSWLFLVFKLPETKRSFTKLNGLQIGHNYLSLLTNEVFVCATCIPILGYAGFISFVTLAPFLYMETFKLSIMEYVFHQGAIILTFSCICMYIGRIIDWLGERNSIIYGTSLCLSAITLLLIISIFLPKLYPSLTAYLTTACMMLYVTGVAFGRSIVLARALEIYPQIKGTASSAISGLRMLISALAISVTGYFYNGTLVLIASSVLCIVVVMFALTKRFLKNFSFE